MAHYDVLIILGWFILVLALVLLSYAFWSFYEYRQNKMKTIRKFKKEQEKQIKELKEKKKQYIHPELKKFKILFDIFKEHADPEGNNLLRDLMIQLHDVSKQEFIIKKWVVNYDKWWKTIGKLDDKLNEYLNKEYWDSVHLLELVNSFDMILYEFIKKADLFHSHAKTCKTLYKSTRENYDRLQGECNALIAEYSVFRDVLYKKYKKFGAKSHLFGRFHSL